MSDLRKRLFMVHLDKWPEFEGILKEYGESYLIAKTDDKGVYIQTALNEKELKALCDFAECRAIEKDQDTSLKVYPLSMLKDFKLAKKYVKDTKKYLVRDTEIDEFVNLGL